MEEEIKLLLREIADHPEDWDRYLILADAFEETGDERRARGCRWAHTWKKRPYTLGLNTKYYWYDSDEAATDNLVDPESDLPSDIFRELAGKEDLGVRKYKRWATFQEAFLTLLETWVK